MLYWNFAPIKNYLKVSYWGLFSQQSDPQVSTPYFMRISVFYDFSWTARLELRRSVQFKPSLWRLVWPLAIFPFLRLTKSCGSCFVWRLTCSSLTHIALVASNNLWVSHPGENDLLHGYSKLLYHTFGCRLSSLIFIGRSDMRFQFLLWLKLWLQMECSPVIYFESLVALYHLVWNILTTLTNHWVPSLIVRQILWHWSDRCETSSFQSCFLRVQLVQV